MKLLHLRKPFTGPVQWDAGMRAWVIERLRDEVRQFLAYCGKPLDFWPTVAGVEHVRAA
jgi:hypothetical protein